MHPQRLRKLALISLRQLMILTATALAVASCSTPERHQKKGDILFSRGEYFEAVLQYKTAYSMTPRKDREARGKRAFLMGECYRRINSVAKAEGAYRNAVRYGYTDTTTYFHLASVERMQGNYKAAAENYRLYLDLKPDDPLSVSGLASCDLAKRMKEEGSTYIVKSVPLLMSRRADYCPVLYGEKSDKLLFTSTRTQATGDEESPITGMKNGDFFYTQKDEKGKWKQVEPLQGSVNTAMDEGAACISPDGGTMYFTYCPTDPEYPRYAEIWSSSRSDATWSKPQKVTLSSDTLSSYAHPAVSPDGRWLYFVSDMPGGLGGYDIWRAELTGHGIGAMENLGAPVNSSGNEMFPTFRPNGDLYFSSDGHPGMGGLDIFCAREDTVSGKWSVNILPSPVNSSGDDFSMTFEGIHNRGYFSSNRKNGRGWDHIYSFEKPEVVQSVFGYVYEQDGYELPAATVYMVGEDGTNIKFGVRADGSFEQQVKPGVKYVLMAVCDSFLNFKQDFSVDSSEVSTTDTLYFPLPSVNSPVLVRNVFYEFNSARLTKSSVSALDNLTRLLKDNPNTSIELSSHCDYRGNELYNRRLSQQRAESVVRYLISRGVESGRLTAVGYGKLRPKVVTKRMAAAYKFLHEGDTLTENYILKLRKSQQDTCNALNRRTEFKVLQTTYGLTDKVGNIDAGALLGKRRGTAERREPVVKVYVPTPAEAAAADGKKLPEKPAVARGVAAAKTAVSKSTAARDGTAKVKKTVESSKKRTAKKDTVAKAPASKSVAAASKAPASGTAVNAKTAAPTVKSTKNAAKNAKNTVQSGTKTVAKTAVSDTNISGKSVDKATKDNRKTQGAEKKTADTAARAEINTSKDAPKAAASKTVTDVAKTSAAAKRTTAGVVNSVAKATKTAEANTNPAAADKRKVAKATKSSEVKTVASKADTIAAASGNRAAAKAARAALKARKAAEAKARRDSMAAAKVAAKQAAAKAKAEKKAAKLRADSVKKARKAAMKAEKTAAKAQAKRAAENAASASVSDSVAAKAKTTDRSSRVRNTVRRRPSASSAKDKADSAKSAVSSAKSAATSVKPSVATAKKPSSPGKAAATSAKNISTSGKKKTQPVVMSKAQQDSIIARARRDAEKDKAVKP